MGESGEASLSLSFFPISYAAALAAAKTVTEHDQFSPEGEQYLCNHRAM